MLDIKITKTEHPKEKPLTPVGLGRVFTDHMFCMNYTEGKGWHDPRIEPYQDLTLSPSAMVFHYGQEMFEGLKAYKNEAGEAFLFRPHKNAARSNETADRICIPTIAEEDYIQALKTLITLEKDWIPTLPETSLYIRPFIIATEPFLGVDISKSYLFMIICSPSGSYYSSGLSPVGIWVEDTYVRAAKGGTGYAKVGGNYAASLIAQKKAKEEGYAQVLWLDAAQRKYIEEVGAMNIFFQISGTLVTPMLTGSVLPGVTRDSVIALAKDWGMEVQERLLSIDELVAAQKSGALEEVFGSGTAAVITPIGTLAYQGEVLQVGNGETGTTTRKVYDTLTGIQYGRLADKFGWRVEI